MMPNNAMNCRAFASMMTPTSILSAPPDPGNDGITHINVHYNLGVEPLGRKLSPFFVARFQHPYFGPFKCVEGLMRYVLSGCVDDTFRSLTGSQAKRHYRDKVHAGELTEYKFNEDRDELDVLISAHYAKLLRHPVIAEQFIQSTLPFDTYFRWDVNGVWMRPDDGPVLIDSLTVLRDLMKAGKKPVELSRAAYAKLEKKR